MSLERYKGKDQESLKKGAEPEGLEDLRPEWCPEQNPGRDLKVCHQKVKANYEINVPVQFFYIFLYKIENLDLTNIIAAELVFLYKCTFEKFRRFSGHSS